MNRFVVREGRREDLADVIGVQHRAFGRVAKALGIDPSRLPPLLETEADLRHHFDGGMRFFVATSASDGHVVGSVRGDERDHAVEIGRLVVDDDWTRQGVATALMDLLEASFPDARRFELFTGAQALEPLELYAKRGYREYRREHHPAVELVWLEKPGPSAIA
jgi:GNAT superfamily N-acetyltransferase